MEKKINLIVRDNDKNLRVDIFINNKEKDISRSRIKNLILDKKLKINNKLVVNPSKKIFNGDKIDLIIPTPKKASLRPFSLAHFSLLSAGGVHPQLGEKRSFCAANNLY